MRLFVHGLLWPSPLQDLLYGQLVQLQPGVPMPVTLSKPPQSGRLFPAVYLSW